MPKLNETGITYHGAPCPHCGGTERYTSVYRCVTCWREYNRNPPLERKPSGRPSILTDKEKRKVARLYKGQKTSMRALAEMFGVSKSVIMRAIHSEAQN